MNHTFNGEKIARMLANGVIVLSDIIISMSCLFYLRISRSTCAMQTYDAIDFRNCQKRASLNLLATIGMMIIIFLINAGLFKIISRKVSLLTLITVVMTIITHMLRYRF